MAFGLPARFAQSRTYPLAAEDALALAKVVLADLGWSYRVHWGKELHAVPTRTPWTWGERLKIEFLPGGVIHAESKCAGARLQIFDFGTNRRNVEIFFARLEQARRG